MKSALAQVAAKLGGTYPAIIDNKPVPSPALFDSVNPSHRRQIVGRCALSSPEQARQAIAAAVAAFPAWGDTDGFRF
jgi:RHH-type proline utilization regulon transcriptional repressor/proline dehydrogenase/delta 1-pyrroline-5-carboxylate dehydrogenase